MLASAPVEPADALADLTEISSEIETAALFDPTGAVAASVGSDGDRLAQKALELLVAASSVRPGVTLTRAEARLRDGSLFVVRDGERLIAATTRPEPASGLVLYDLRTALERSESVPEPPKPRRRRTAKAETEGGDGAA